MLRKRSRFVKKKFVLVTKEEWRGDIPENEPAQLIGFIWESTKLCKGSKAVANVFIFNSLMRVTLGWWTSNWKKLHYVLQHVCSASLYFYARKNSHYLAGKPLIIKSWKFIIFKLCLSAHRIKTGDSYSAPSECLLYWARFPSVGR